MNLYSFTKRHFLDVFSKSLKRLQQTDYWRNTRFGFHSRCYSDVFKMDVGKTLRRCASANFDSYMCDKFKYIDNFLSAFFTSGSPVTISKVLENIFRRQNDGISCCYDTNLTSFERSERQIDVETTMCDYSNPSNRQCCLTSFERSERQMDVETTVCNYSDSSSSTIMLF